VAYQNALFAEEKAKFIAGFSRREGFEEDFDRMSAKLTKNLPIGQ
jgi:hypothetical protein